MPATSVSKRTFISLVLGVILMLGVCTFTYCNRMGKLRVVQAEVEQKQEKLANSERVANYLSAAEDEYLNAKAMLSFLEQGVSTKVYVPTFLRQIEELGKKVNLRVVGVRPQPAREPPPAARSSAACEEEKTQAEAEPEPYDKMAIDIEINGKYQDVVRFLYEITSFPKIVAVNDVKVNTVGQTKRLASPLLSVKLKATAFILKEQAGADGHDSRAAAAVAGRA